MLSPSTSHSHPVELIARAARCGDRVALVDRDGVMTYRELLHAAECAATTLLNGTADLAEARVAFIAPPGRHYVIAQWGIWLAGGVAVPLCVTHPPLELEYTLTDSDASTVVAHRDFEAVARPLAAKLGRRFVTSESLGGGGATAKRLPQFSEDRRALILYTSGTTGRPKGVVTTHRTLRAQITSLIEAWGWSESDRILHVLPLHHLHGILAVLCCPLWAGAVCELMPRFDAVKVWEAFQSGRFTLFMAVPSIYQRLVQAWEAADVSTRQRWSQSCATMRLMVSGSAALPVPMLERWREISGHTLLERYGMTEIGLAISNPLHGTRVPGAVGAPLPGAEVRLRDEIGRDAPAGEPGEIQVRGPVVFSEYWRRPEETRQVFIDGWFRTGDIGVCERGVYRILGRNSVDIIKSGGYKVSALEIEQALLSHPLISECAVVGVPDPALGERVCAAICWRDQAGVALEELRTWAKERLAVYKVPSYIQSMNTLPRNAMGKVIKKDVAKLMSASMEGAAA